MKKISTLWLALTVLLALPLSVSADDDIFDFQNNTLGLPVGEGQTFTDGALSHPVTVGSVTLTSIQGDAFYPAIMMKDNSGVISLNVYKNGAIQLSAADGRALTKVTATMKSKPLSQMTASTGSTTENTWEGNTTSVTFSASALMSFLKLEVTTAAKNSETEEPVVESYDMEAADINSFNMAEDGKTIKLALTNARVNGHFNGSYYVEDATGATVVKGITLTTGTTLNGYIIGTKSTDNGIDYMGVEPAPYEPQLTASDASTFEATSTTLVGTVMTIGDAATQANYGRLITLENVTISGGGQNKTLTDANGRTIKARDYMGVLSADYSWPSSASKITGVVIYYMTGWFLMPVSSDAIVDAAAESNTALFDFANNNGSWPVGTSTDPNAGNLEQTALHQDHVTLTFVSSPTMPTRYYVNGERGPQLQLIKGGQMRITAQEGYAVVAISVTPNKTTNASTGAEVTNVAWTVDKGDGTLATDKLSWTGNASSVRFTATGATYLNAIEVTTAPVNAATITPEADTYTSTAANLAAFDELADGTLTILTLTDAVVTAGMVNEWGFYLQDATAGAHFYCTGLNYPVGTKLNGKILVKKSKQTMGARIAMTEETNGDQLTTADGGSYEPVSGTIAEVNVAFNILKVVRLSDVAVKGTKETEATMTDAAGSSLTISNGKNNFYPYVYQTNLTTINYQKATVEGILMGGNKLIPFSITDTTADAVHDISNGHSDKVVIYNMQGIRQQTLQHGLNIVNGKKIIKK